MSMQLAYMFLFSYKGNLPEMSGVPTLQCNMTECKKFNTRYLTCQEKLTQCNAGSLNIN